MIMVLTAFFLALAFLAGCASTSPSSRLIPIPPPADLLDGFNCQQLALLDTLVAAEIKVLSEAYDELFRKHQTYGLASALGNVGSALAVPGSAMQRLGQASSASADRDRDTAWYFLRQNAPQLALELRSLKGAQPSIARTLELCGSKLKHP